SFVFTQLIPDPVTLIPFVGFELLMTKDFWIGAELGLPYTGFDVRSGHDRFSSFETVRKDSWDGFGKSGSGRLSYVVSDNVEIFAVGGQEKYTPRFAGEKATIRIVFGFFGIKVKF
ncbi:MAG: hypothetical protein V3V62_04040, partial [bacterium]